MTQIEYAIFKFLILLDVCWETKNVNLNFQRSDRLKSDSLKICLILL